MGAQAGVWNFDGAPASREMLANISQAISRYGPDGEATYFSGSIGMLYRAFHTTKESRLERQPHVFCRGSVIIWDGRLDNRDELIPQLRDDLSPGQTDLAIVIAAFKRWETDCFRKLIGDWALSIWDPVQRVLILARDYVGVRHLYYYPTHKRVIWCSYLAPLVLSGGCFDLNDEYIAGYLAFYPEAHLTPYREIQAVPPGKFVCIRDGKATVHPYWAFDPKLTIRHKTDAEYEDHFRQVFRQAVRRRLRSDCPVLAELSGGLDSSSIVCMADDILAMEGAETPRLDTLSLYDPKDPGADERPHFSKVEEKRGRKGHHFDFNKCGNFLSLDHHEFISVPGSSERRARQITALSELIQSQGYRVVLSGMGGDEFLGGVPNPRPQLADLIMLPQPIKLAKQLGAWSLVKKSPGIQLLFQTLVFLLPQSLRAIFTKEAKVARWIDSTFARRYRLPVRQLGPQRSYGFWQPSRRDYARTFVGMTWQLAFFHPHAIGFEEKRYPYLDQTLIEFLSSIPASQLLRPGQRRSLMRRALVDLVPKEILLRRTKGAVARSVLTAFQNSRPELERLFVSPLSARMGYVKQANLQDCLRAASADVPQLVRLVKAIYLELWLQSLAEHGVMHFALETPLSLDKTLPRQERDFIGRLFRLGRFSTGRSR